MNENLNNNSNAGNETTDNMSEQEQTTVVPETTGEVEETTPTEQQTSTTESFAMVEVNEEKIVALQAELDDQKDKYVRMVADFDNFRRRSNKEYTEMNKTAGKDIITSLLVVLDDMDRAAKQIETSTDLKSITDGVSLVFSKMRSIMQKNGLKAMEPKNEKFNPDFHEALAEIPVDSDKKQGLIIDVVEPGYYLNDKLIRCAKVVIGKRAETL